MMHPRQPQVITRKVWWWHFVTHIVKSHMILKLHDMPFSSELRKYPRFHNITEPKWFDQQFWSKCSFFDSDNKQIKGNFKEFLYFFIVTVEKYVFDSLSLYWLIGLIRIHFLLLFKNHCWTVNSASISSFGITTWHFQLIKNE